MLSMILTGAVVIGVGVLANVLVWRELKKNLRLKAECREMLKKKLDDLLAVTGAWKRPGCLLVGHDSAWYEERPHRRFILLMPTDDEFWHIDVDPERGFRVHLRGSDSRPRIPDIVYPSEIGWSRDVWLVERIDALLDLLKRLPLPQNGRELAKELAGR